jgi:hypothetical protein
VALDELAEAELFSPLWSAAIFEELRRHLLEAGLSDVAVDRTLARMSGTFEDADVIGYEYLVESPATFTDHSCPVRPLDHRSGGGPCPFLRSRVDHGRVAHFLDPNRAASP